MSPNEGARRLDWLRRHSYCLWTRHQRMHEMHLSRYRRLWGRAKRCNTTRKRLVWGTILVFTLSIVGDHSEAKSPIQELSVPTRRLLRGSGELQLTSMLRSERRQSTCDAYAIFEAGCQLRTLGSCCPQYGNMSINRKHDSTVSSESFPSGLYGRIMNFRHPSLPKLRTHLIESRCMRHLLPRWQPQHEVTPKVISMGILNHNPSESP